jgi:predicted acetyltransferase
MTDDRAAEYRFSSFRAGTVRGEANAETAGWMEAATLGFHEAAPAPAHMARTAEMFDADERVLTGAYAASYPARAWEPTHPVATYGTLVKPLNVGGGGSLDAHLIASVTVRPNHRRRGLMRELITQDLRRARESGRAVAALSSMEATIYGRFGFGAATFSRQVEVDTSDRFHLNAQPLGSVEITDPSTLLDVAPTLFDQFHSQTLGSVQRPASYPSKISGAWAEDEPEPDRKTRAALHYDPAGVIDGYVAYKVLGWDVEPLTIKVVDIVWTCQNAYLGLWDYLASIDLVTRVTLGHASMNDALPWAMADRRGFKIVGEADGLWLRILDPVAALEARSYEADGEVRIAVSDPLAIADGVYVLSAREGRATVTRDRATGSSFDVSMDMSAFGSLYLGGVRAGVLARAGQVVSTSSAAIDTLDSLLAHKEIPHCITHF